MKKVIVAFGIAGMLGSWAARPATGEEEARPVKIAVAADGEAATATVEGRGARAHFLLFFDAEGKRIESVENPYREQGRRAGPSCAELLAKHGATVFVAGQIGGNMRHALSSLGIDSVSFTGTVEAAVAHVLSGRGAGAE